MPSRHASRGSDVEVVRGRDACVLFLPTDACASFSCRNSTSSCWHLASTHFRNAFCSGVGGLSEFSQVRHHSCTFDVSHVWYAPAWYCFRSLGAVFFVFLRRACLCRASSHSWGQEVCVLFNSVPATSGVCVRGHIFPVVASASFINVETPGSFVPDVTGARTSSGKSSFPLQARLLCIMFVCILLL